METFNFYCSLSIISSEWSFIYFHLCFFLLSLGCLFCFFFKWLVCGHADFWLLFAQLLELLWIDFDLWGAPDEKLYWWATCFLLLGFGCAWTNLLDLGRTRTKLLLLKNLGASQQILTTAVNFLLASKMWSLTGNIGAMFKMIWDVNCSDRNLCLHGPDSVFIATVQNSKKEHPASPKSSSQAARSRGALVWGCVSVLEPVLCWQEPVPALTVC